MKIGELADLLRELDMLTGRYIDQKDWIGRFEARGETTKVEEQKLRIEEIKQKIMAIRDKEIGVENMSKKSNPMIDTTADILDMSNEVDLCVWWKSRGFPVDPKKCCVRDVLDAKRLMLLVEDLQTLKEHPPCVV